MVNPNLKFQFSNLNLGTPNLKPNEMLVLLSFQNYESFATIETFHKANKFSHIVNTTNVVH
jgi:hypothetical protein